MGVGVENKIFNVHLFHIILRKDLNSIFFYGKKENTN